MSAIQLYTQIRKLLSRHVDDQVDESSRERLSLMVLAMIKGKTAAPSRMAHALKCLGLSGAKVESIERRLRRTENDPEITADSCFHPFARQRLLFGKAKELILILDPTTKKDRVVMLTASVWYRGRALPLAWAIWPANQPLEGKCLWERVEGLLALVTEILPQNIPITWLADSAFGCPAFTDLLEEHDWSYIVRVQGQTHCKDRIGTEWRIDDLVRLPGQRRKLRGVAFKKRGWRDVSVVVYWGRRYPKPLCLVSNLPAKWYLIKLYRRRYPIEATFRDYKSHGWHWEQGQVTDLEHLERLLVAMALATWIALFVGTQVAAEILAHRPTGQRRTIPWEGKRSLFTLGLQRLDEWLHANGIPRLRAWLSDWEAPNWQTQIHSHHLRAFIFGSRA